MKQKQSNTVKSEKRCACGCGKFLKQNLVNKNPEAEFIYKHFPLSKKNRSGAHGLGRNRRRAKEVINES